MNRYQQLSLAKRKRREPPRVSWCSLFVRNIMQSEKGLNVEMLNKIMEPGIKNKSNHTGICFSGDEGVKGWFGVRGITEEEADGTRAATDRYFDDLERKIRWKGAFVSLVIIIGFLTLVLIWGR